MGNERAASADRAPNHIKLLLIYRIIKGPEPFNMKKKMNRLILVPQEFVITAVRMESRVD